MKLTSRGKLWIWEEETEKRKLDEKYLEAQKKFKSSGRSIWGTEECEQCGACCYKFQISSLGKEKDQNYAICTHQRIEKTSICTRHGKEKPIECKNYGCWKREYKMGTDAERYAMMLIAIDILHTKKESDLIRALQIAEDIPMKT